MKRAVALQHVAFEDLGTLHPLLLAQGWQVYRQHSAAHVAPSVVRHAERFAHRAGTALTVLAEQDVLVHGDIRADNVFFSGDGCKIVDYQMTARGVGAIDIAYLVSQGLPTVLRVGRDAELVRGYLDELASRSLRTGRSADMLALEPVISRLMLGALDRAR